MQNGWTDHDVRSFRGGKCYGTGLHNKVGQDHDVRLHHAVICLDVRGQRVWRGILLWRDIRPRRRYHLPAQFRIWCKNAVESDVEPRRRDHGTHPRK